MAGTAVFLAGHTFQVTESIQSVGRLIAKDDYDAPGLPGFTALTLQQVEPKPILIRTSAVVALIEIELP